MEPEWLGKPVRLNADNFTTLKRTPWAGLTIGRRYKHLVLPDVVGQPIGESWEFSCDPSHPSHAVDWGITLADLIAREPDKALGGTGAQCDILVKLLNPAKPLSLQVHPTDDDTGLKAGECGKPESWLVLQADEGAGIYLGFKHPLPKAELQQKLAAEEDLAPLLQFVPVKPGDYFEIEPGVVHALGPGLTLLEPQRVIPGLSGKTYRFWDWGRRYDDSGREHPDGKPRALHWQEALSLVDPQRQAGPSFVDSLRRSGKRFFEKSFQVVSYPANSYGQVHLVEAKAGQLSCCVQNAYGILVILEGQADFAGVSLEQGESAFVPAPAFPLAMSVPDRCRFALIQPASGSCSFKP